MHIYQLHFRVDSCIIKMKKKAPIIPQQYEGDILMATSSIFSNVVIRSEKSARAFVRAFEACQKNPMK